MKKILVLIVLAFSLNVKAQIAERAVQAAEDIIEVNGEAEEVIGAFQDAGSQFETVRGRFQDAYELYEDFENLDLTECSPDFSNNVSNSMVATCGANEECKECYKTAMKSMNFYRKQLGRLNCIYNNTVNFSNRAIAFGDTYSGFHAMSGVAWQKQKTDILKSLDKLKITYDTKYTEFIKGLATSLRSFDTCEQQFGGNGNWYQKVGFIYFEFMKDKYKRNN